MMVKVKIALFIISIIGTSWITVDYCNGKRAQEILDLKDKVKELEDKSHLLADSQAKDIAERESIHQAELKKLSKEVSKYVSANRNFAIPIDDDFVCLSDTAFGVSKHSESACQHNAATADSKTHLDVLERDEHTGEAFTHNYQQVLDLQTYINYIVPICRGSR